jgi:hypothetical protein
MSNHGWIIRNGSGWNHHRTIDTLQKRRTWPRVPKGYAVVCGPISDKPLGIRCALVRELPRKMEPGIDYHQPAGNYLNSGPELTALNAAEPDDLTPASAKAHLESAGFAPCAERPAGWPEGRDWYRHADGTWASVEMLDDGPDGEPDYWVRERADIDGEIVASVREDQQTHDASDFFLNTMRTEITALKS